MIDDSKIVLFLWNCLVNSTLAFFTLRILLKIFLRCYSFSNRAKVVWSALLFVHLILHPFTYTWTQWGEENPWEAEAGTREISIILCYPSLNLDWNLLQWLPTTHMQMRYLDGRTFTPADCMGYLLPFWLIQVSVWVAGIGVCIYCTRFLYALLCERRLYRAATVQSRPLPIINGLDCASFARALEREGIEIRLSSELRVPCAYGIWRPRIFMPSSLRSSLTQEEWQAILMHEWSHLHYRDIPLLMFCRAVACLFWWIPTRSVLDRLVAWQEEACDDAVHVWKSDPHDLAMALCHVMREQHVPHEEGLAFPLTGRAMRKSMQSMQREAIKHRIQRLICYQPRPPRLSRSPRPFTSHFFNCLRIVHFLRYWILTLIMASVVCGRFWTF